MGYVRVYEADDVSIAYVPISEFDSSDFLYSQLYGLVLDWTTVSLSGTLNVEMETA